MYQPIDQETNNPHTIITTNSNSSNNINKANIYLTLPPYEKKISETKFRSRKCEQNQGFKLLIRRSYDDCNCGCTIS